MKETFREILDIIATLSYLGICVISMVNLMGVYKEPGVEKLLCYGEWNLGKAVKKNEG